MPPSNSINLIAAQEVADHTLTRAGIEGVRFDEAEQLTQIKERIAGFLDAEASSRIIAAVRMEGDWKRTDEVEKSVTKAMWWMQDFGYDHVERFDPRAAKARNSDIFVYPGETGQLHTVAINRRRPFGEATSSQLPADIMPHARLMIFKNSWFVFDLETAKRGVPEISSAIIALTLQKCQLGRRWERLNRLYMAGNLTLGNFGSFLDSDSPTYDDDLGYWHYACIKAEEYDVASSVIFERIFDNPNPQRLQLKETKSLVELAIRRQGLLVPAATEYELEVKKMIDVGNDAVQREVSLNGLYRVGHRRQQFQRDGAVR